MPIIIDVEASGFGAQSYPIEVGVIKQNGERFCSLIRPHKTWTHWDPQAEALHHISKNLLEKKGRDIVEVCIGLNAFLKHEIAFSDGWVVDQPWLIRLFHTAGINMNFTLSPLEMILSESQMALWHLTKDNLQTELKLPRHRASSDAALIQDTFRVTRELSEKYAREVV